MTGRADVRLVINADDFGRTPAISRGILRAHREGVVTSTSVVGNHTDLAGLRTLLTEAPDLGVGLHLVLAGGVPVTDPAEIPSLVDPGGRFWPSVPRLAVKWARNELVAGDIEHEFDAQVTRAREAGLALDHLDTHGSVGFLPIVGRAMETVARRHDIPGLRTTSDGPTLDWITQPRRGLEATALRALSWMTRRQLGALRHGPQSWGFVERGALDEIRILEILGRLAPGDHELVCHPTETIADAAVATGPEIPDRPSHSVEELTALTSATVKTAIARRGVKLCRWRDLF